ncbi:MAG: Alpha/beta hydrolase [Candidatus Gottesmanbacteria bacterium GW2011_GWA2_47_9]|uniref:Alpha/beta hydrolase n=2 Tax=Candidatus Gottesmaniibacteriota TaxID=1752720 RepID=A0A0G1UNZ3_9BACT|nr:MAG: Alpha/beta hydrolase [Candidatus Gottesmanbacteria bacterium GW2011_GWA2_47_9]KKU95859.1 MAG: Alpha/beta hydrolase [Candidatus Gottesmanbacteria bacterium GW2011_GWA1_48_13]
MTTKNALILHAWYNKPEDNWYPWLAKELTAKGYHTVLPNIPSFFTDAPSLPDAMRQIESLDVLRPSTIIIGHSLSCLLAMRLAEKHQYAKMMLVAGWDFDDLTKEHASFWQNKINHGAIKKNVKDIYCISSDNDPYMAAFQVEEMSKRLGGKFVLIKGAGHFLAKDGITNIPQLLAYL